MSFEAIDAEPISELPAGYAHELIELCGRWGVDASALLEGTGLTMPSLRDPAARMSLETCQTIVERARSLTREPGLAFFMGMQMRLSWHGFLGFASMTAGSLGEALEIAERFSLTRTAAFGLSSCVEGDRASLVLEERAAIAARPELRALREFVVIALLVGIARIASTVTGRTLDGVAECAFPEPDYAGPILARAAEAQAGTMRFGQPAHRLLFDASVLDLPLLGADPVATQLARAQCDRELAALAETGGFTGRVRSAMPAADGFRSLDEVAARMAMSSRTLKRKLAAQGTSFSDVLESVRRQRALLLLDDRGLGMEAIAARLGYSDVANFTRAFRRWTGTTPAAFRRARQRGAT